MDKPRCQYHGAILRQGYALQVRLGIQRDVEFARILRLHRAQIRRHPQQPVKVHPRLRCQHADRRVCHAHQATLRQPVHQRHASQDQERQNYLPPPCRTQAELASTNFHFILIHFISDIRYTLSYDDFTFNSLIPSIVWFVSNGTNTHSQNSFISGFLVR